MKKILAVLAILGMGLMVSPVMAIDENVFNPICSDGNLTENQMIEAGCDDRSKEGMSRITNLVNVAVGLAGLVAVVVIVFGGQRYLTSAGDPGRVKQAKDMITYGVIGVIVAGLAWAIVNFVVAGVSGGEGGGTTTDTTESTTTDTTESEGTSTNTTTNTIIENTTTN